MSRAEIISTLPHTCKHVAQLSLEFQQARLKQKSHGVTFCFCRVRKINSGLKAENVKKRLITIPLGTSGVLDNLVDVFNNDSTKENPL